MGEETLMDSPVPPPVLDGARLLAYAVVDGTVVHAGTSSLHVDGKPIGAVPGLAICQQDAGMILLMFCDDHWSPVGVVQCSSLPEAKSRAEREYKGLSGKWVDAHVSELEATRYMEEQNAAQRCSFCGKSPEAVQQLFAASGARICDSCVRDFYGSLKIPS
jgi:hypothetical protein